MNGEHRFRVPEMSTQKIMISCKEKYIQKLINNCVTRFHSNDELFKRSYTHCVQNYLKFLFFLLFLLVKLYRIF